MLTLYCPNCWESFRQNVDRCPVCDGDLHRAWDMKDYVDKIIAALRHPVHETVIHAAWILGQRRESRGVEALANLVRSTEDIYIALAAVKALGDIGNPEARAFLKTISTHSKRLVRETVNAILNTDHPDENEKGLRESTDKTEGFS